MASLTGWTEGILLSLLFVGIFAGLIGGMNIMYGEDNQIGLGTNTTESAFSNYQDTLESQVKGGEVVYDADKGMTLKTSYGIVKQSMTIIWDFLTGGWIESISNMMHLPVAVAVTFRVIYFLSLGFILLRILFKITKP